MKRKFEACYPLSQQDSTIHKIQKAQEPIPLNQEISDFWNQADIKIKQNLKSDYSSSHPP
jgi:hypothetical protein